MRFGSWNVKSLYRAGSLTAAAGELARHKLDLVGVHEVRCDKRVTVRAGDYNYSYGKETKIINRERDFCIKMDLKEVGVGVWIGSSWLRTGTGGGHL